MDTEQDISKTLRQMLKTEFCFLCIFSSAIGLLFLTGPLYMMQIYDRVLNSQSIPTLVGLTLLIIVLYAAMGTLDWVRNCIFSLISSKTENAVSAPTFTAVLKTILRTNEKRAFSLLTDLNSIKRFLSSPSPAAFFDAPWSIILLFVLFLLHWAYGLLALGGAIVLFILAFSNQKTTQKHLENAEFLNRQTQHHAQETTDHIQAAHALGMKSRLQSIWYKKLDSADETMLQATMRMGAFSASAKAFRLMLQSGILGLGAWLVIHNLSTPGSMIAASIIMGRAIAPIEQITTQWRTVSATLRSWSRLKKTLDSIQPSPPPLPLPNITGQIKVEKLISGHDNSPILKDINFKLQSGDCLAVIGPSASGKTTLAETLTGVLHPKSGAVRFDEAAIEQYDPDVLGKQIGYLPQNISLMDGTVSENISRFEESVSPQSIIEAAQKADCHEFILNLPKGYDTPIGSGGVFLSGGQRQRIGLARALFNSPKFVVLDEPNSNLDAEGEVALQNSIDQLKKGRCTIVLIAHKYSALTHCNKILVLENGQIGMFGLKNEVLSKLKDTTHRSNRTLASEGAV